MSFAGHGWPVLRGTYLAPGGGPHYWLGRRDAVGLRPVDDDWAGAHTLRAADVARWWAIEPYSVIIACGHHVDCVELPSPAAPQMFIGLREAGITPPTMITPVGNLVLFARTHPGPRRFNISVSLRSTGDWVAVPPTNQAANAADPARGYRWLSGASPGALSWRLPALPDLCDVIDATARGATVHEERE